MNKLSIKMLSKKYSFMNWQSLLPLVQGEGLFPTRRLQISEGNWKHVTHPLKALALHNLWLCYYYFMYLPYMLWQCLPSENNTWFGSE